MWKISEEKSKEIEEQHFIDFDISMFGLAQTPKRKAPPPPTKPGSTPIKAGPAPGTPPAPAPGQGGAK